MPKGLIQVYTGDGKGKTTAAMGAALRMLGHGNRVGMVQFFKRSTHNAQSATKVPVLRVDRCALRQYDRNGELESLKKVGSQFRVWNFGGGFTWKTPRTENVKAVRKAWEKCRELLRSSKYNLVILDEIHIALKYKFLKSSIVIKALKKRPVTQHVLLTGRGAPKAIVRLADLVTEMKCVKHPFKRGVLAQPGIEF